MSSNGNMRKIPKVDDLLHQPEIASRPLDRSMKTSVIREILEEIRVDLRFGNGILPPETDICARILARLNQIRRQDLCRVINGTGVVLHTNLGRAPMAKEAADAASDAAGGYSNLEYDLNTGSRGDRCCSAERRLQKLTGAESALIVNNNAAAVLLILSALGAGHEAVISRGELVEIGGSFRVPEIMESCGCILREVGTTNKTHLTDYARAIGENTFALMKVHTSNFRIVGFTSSVSVTELAELAHEHDLPVIEDMGSAFPVRIEGLDAMDLPCAAESLAAGVDIVCFSGDKLLGGPQAGIILGRSRYIDQLKKHPLMRALRVDKMTIAALDTTLALYAEGVAGSKIPVLQMLLASPAQLRLRAERLCKDLNAAGITAQVVSLNEQVGGGSAPSLSLPGWGVALTSPHMGPDAIREKLRKAEHPVVGRIFDNQLCLDVRTIPDEAFPLVVASAVEAML